jgi:superfamily I DNA/RNA helicase
MHRLKGLEYKRIIIVAVADGLIPRRGSRGSPTVTRVATSGNVNDRSLLFVAATRARDELAVSWHWDPSPFLPNHRVSHAV